MRKIKILYLYSELMGYQIPVLKEYVTTYGAQVDVIHWDNNKFTPYVPPAIFGVQYFKRSEFSLKKLKEFVIKSSPDIIYISGWMDKGYLRAILPLRKQGVPVVTAFDDIWLKTFRQRVASVLFPLIKSFFFSHAWVAGPYQFEFAKRLGFKNDEIIFNCLSGDTLLFNSVYSESIVIKKANYPHKFLYVGRFEEIKGVDILVQAWRNIKERNESKNWDLTLIGNGSLYKSIATFPGIKIINFLDPEQLAIEIKKYGCFILPSRSDQWGLVLHEFAAAGFPIICSNVCGASPVFVTKNYNGYTFNANDVEHLEKQMLKIINADNTELFSMANKSHVLGQKITPELSAAAFVSIIQNTAK
jgi:glycosyltransferase involved in cell wall biosynthesis